jgi:uncharacterized Zn finger protein (UPF0148 family)
MASTYKWCTKCGEQVVMNDVFECPVCQGSSFTHKKESLDESVPAASVANSQHSKAPAPKPKSEPLKQKSSLSSESADIAQLIQLQQESIRATNRATHAIRAFVLFIFYQLAASTAAAFFYGIGLGIAGSSDECQNNGICEPSSFFIVVSALIFLGGVIFSSMKGWEEIGKSDL